MENKSERQKSDLARKILQTLKANILLMVCIVVIVTAIGGVYAFLRTPEFMASRYTVYHAKIVDTFNSSEPDYYNTTATEIYLDTVADFCDEPCVVARANYYYDLYKVNNYADVEFLISEIESGKTLSYKNEYTGISELSTHLKEAVKVVKIDGTSVVGRVESYDETSGTLKIKGEEETYTVNKTEFEKAMPFAGYIKADKISINYTPKMDDEGNFNITVGYYDADQKEAFDKVRVLVFAIDQEAKVESILSTNTNKEFLYFGVEVHVDDLGPLPTVVDYTKTFIILVSGVLGVIVAIAVVFIKNLFNNSVADKETIERITGANLLSYIDDMAEGK